MPTARAIAPDGKVLVEFTRPRGERARLSTKGHQIRLRRLTEDEFEQINTYEAGTRITCNDGQPDEYWDGQKWGPVPSVPQSELAGGSARVGDASRHIAPQPNAQWTKEAP